MTRPVPISRPLARVAAARLPAYTAFALSIGFASALIIGLVG